MRLKLGRGTFSKHDLFFAVRVIMAERGYSGLSSEVSFMDLPMCACVLEQTAEQQVLKITAAQYF